MMRKVMRLFLAALVFALPCLMACSSMECAIDGMVRCNYALLDAKGDAVELPGVLSVSVPREQAGLNDTTLINKLEKASIFRLPMSYALDVDELHFLYAPSATSELGMLDVVKIKKTNEPVFEGVECPARFKHVIEEVSSSHNFIDSVVVNNKKVDNDASKTHIYIYVRTANM